MATSKEKVNWINKYMVDMMNSSDQSTFEAKRHEIERYSKKLSIDSLNTMENQTQNKGIAATGKIGTKQVSIRKPILQNITRSAYELVSIQCPKCSSSNPFGSSICQNCKYILTFDRKKWLNELSNGNALDIKDKHDRWFVGIVSRRDNSNLTVAYYGWNSQFDELVPITSERLQPYRTYTTDDNTAITSVSYNSLGLLGNGQDVYVTSGMGGSNSWLKGTIQEVNIKELTCTLHVGDIVITKFSLVCD